MKFWTNFAKKWKSWNIIKWTQVDQYDASDKNKSNYMVIDNKSNLGMQTDSTSFLSLTKDLYKEDVLTELEKCVLLFQMLTYVGDDLYSTYEKDYPGKCSRNESEQFLIDNSDFIDY